MRLSEGLGKRQTKASPPLVFAAEVAVDLAEMAERLGNVVEPDAAARVDNLEHIASIRAGPGSYRDLAASRRELYRVGQEVDQNLLELAIVSVQRRETIRDNRFQIHIGRLGALLHQEQAGPDGLGNVNGTLMNNPG